MKILITTLLTLLLSIFSVEAQNKTSLESEYDILMELYNSLNGDEWNVNYGWKNPNHCNPCSGWYGVECKKNRVVKINLQHNNLNGTIPTSIQYLENLEILLLGENDINGNIPESIVNLSNLKVLQLSKNEISGELPSTFGKLKKLEKLFLTYNTIEGEIPESFAELTALQILYLGANNLSGILPSFLGELENLEAIVISENMFEPIIPESLNKIHISVINNSRDLEIMADK